MTGDDINSDKRDGRQQPLSPLEARVVDALAARAESIEPSPDAYRRLARAVNGAPDRRLPSFGWSGFGPGAGSTSWLQPLAYVSVIAAALVGGIWLLADQRGPSPETVTAAAGSSDPTGPDEGWAPESDLDSDRAESNSNSQGSTFDTRPGGLSGTSSTLPDATVSGQGRRVESDPDRRLEGLTYAPVKAAKIEAAEAFLQLLSLSPDRLEVDGEAVIALRSTDPGGQEWETISELTLAPIGDGWMVLEARSTHVEFDIDNQTVSDLTEDDIDDPVSVEKFISVDGTMTGTTAMSSEVTVTVHSAVDGTLLIGSTLEPGQIDGAGGVRLELPVLGAERVWIVVRAGSDGNAPFAARSVQYVGDKSPVVYTIFGVGPNDPDGGLILRDAPNGTPLDTIASGSEGVQRRNLPPRRVDGLTWWAVTTPSGADGWVAAHHLIPDGQISDDVLIDTARRILGEVVDGGTISAPIHDPVLVGSIVEPLTIHGGVTDPTAWTVSRRLTTPDGEYRGSFDKYLGFDRWADPETSVFVPNSYQSARVEEVAAAWYGDLPSVVIRTVNPESGRAERVHLFVSQGDSGMGGGDSVRIAAIVKELEPAPPEDS